LGALVAAPAFAETAGRIWTGGRASPAAAEILREAHDATVTCMNDGILSLTAAMLDDVVDGRAE